MPPYRFIYAPGEPYIPNGSDTPNEYLSRALYLTLPVLKSPSMSKRTIKSAVNGSLPISSPNIASLASCKTPILILSCE